jgi:hypothetical protein
MKRSLRNAWIACLVLAAASPVLACSICAGNIQQGITFRQEVAGDNAKLILYGSLANPRLTSGTNGVTDLRVEAVVKPHESLGNKKLVEVPRYLPVSDPKNPPRYLIFCDVYNGKLDMYRGVPVKSAAVVDYLKGALAIKDRTKQLLYYFDYLENGDPEIANDAFLEFAKAGDQEVGQVASKLSSDKLRGWLKAPQTPENRLGLYAFLLGSCGTAVDAAYLRTQIEEPTERSLKAFDGMLGAYMLLRPREGWDLALTTLRDEKKPFTIRFGVLRTLRFFHGWKPADYRNQVLLGLRIMLPQGDIADLAIEDLRRAQLWDLTKEVLDQFGKKSHDAPIMKQAIVRYALTCPKPEAAAFVANVRATNADLVADVEESLKAEKR